MKMSRDFNCWSLQLPDDSHDSFFSRAFFPLSSSSTRCASGLIINPRHVLFNLNN